MLTITMLKDTKNIHLPVLLLFPFACFFPRKIQKNPIKEPHTAYNATFSKNPFRRRSVKKSIIYSYLNNTEDIISQYCTLKKPNPAVWNFINVGSSGAIYFVI